MPALPFNGSYLTLGLLILCTIVGIVMAVRYRREVDDLAPTTAREMLGPLEQAYYAGLMHPDEIERIRESVKNTKLPVDRLVPKQVSPSGGATDAAVFFMGDSSFSGHAGHGHGGDGGHSHGGDGGHGHGGDGGGGFGGDGGGGGGGGDGGGA